MNTDDKGYNEWFNRVWVPSLPTEPTADGFKRPWVDTAVAGLYWEDCGEKMPTRGLEITNLALAQTLLVKTSFTRAEFDLFGVQQDRRESGKLQLGDWIKVTSKIKPEIKSEKQGGEKHGSGEVVVYFKTVDAQAKAAKEAKAKAAGEAKAAQPGSPTRSSSFSRASSPSPTRPEKNKASAKGIPSATPKSRSPTPGARSSPKVQEDV
jgi:hypothetical protein